MPRILIAGIGGGSLGIEIAKSLSLAGRHHVMGCDVSPLAFGHYSENCEKTFLVSADDYVDDLLRLCAEEGVEVIIPGANSPASLISAAQERFEAAGILVAANTPEVVALASDKARCFEKLAQLGVAIPSTSRISGDASFGEISYPCVIKPSSDSGGSAFVFFARDAGEAKLYSAYLMNNGKDVVAQEYVSHENGEFTVGVLSDAAGEIEGVIALKRVFPAKLSIMASGRDFLISSGVSQGHIGLYKDVCDVAVEIARKFQSRGPFNVQGRVDAHGRFLPFEINPRFSASTYLRTLAGFNEVDHFIAMRLGLPVKGLAIKPGWYLRGVTEEIVTEGELKT